VTFTADTGASRSVVSSRVYDQLSTKDKPVLKGSVKLRGAGGSPIREKGAGEFNLILGPVKVICQAVVADIEDEVLLGLDVLAGEKDGQADIFLSKNIIKLKGKEIPLIPATRRLRKVTVAEDVAIPGLSEVVVDVYVERDEADDKDKEENFIIEPTEGFVQRYPLVMAATLVNINRAVTCKVKVLNPFSTSVTLRHHAEIGEAERIDCCTGVIANEENEGERDNITTVRRVQLMTVEKDSRISDLPVANAMDVPPHLKSLFEESVVGKTEEQQSVIAGLLVKYADTFSKDEWDLGLTHLSEHAINTGTAAPVKQRPRRVPLAYAEEEKKALEDLLKKGVIQKSTSPWASPIVLVKKKSGAIRPCVDYRRVNALVKPDGFPLPRIQDCLDAVAGSSFFSCFDLTSGYFQIPLKKDDIPKSAFCCKYGQYEMKTMPFGLNNAASTFQRTMELALQGLTWLTCLVYIDDIVVFGSTWLENLLRTDEVLLRIQTAGLKLKSDKCRLLQSKVIFLGHVVSGEGISPDPTNIEKIVNWPKPGNAKQVKQFVATGSYYRRFVKDYAKIARPLIDLTRKEAKFEWNDACDMAFKRIKDALISENVMGHPLNEGGTFYLDVDASGTGIGAVLSQEQQSRERVIAYASRGLNKAEKNYCITEQELLAAVYFIQYFRQYLLGRHFIVRTDHQSLIWLFSLKEPSGKIARWIEILAVYDFSIEYRAGNKQAHCDALSRCESPRFCTCSDVDTSEPLKCGPCNKCRRRAELMLLKPNEKEEGEVNAGSPEDDCVTPVVLTENAPVIKSVKSSECEVPKPGPSDDRGSSTLHTWATEFTSVTMAAMQSDDPYIAKIYSVIRDGIKAPVDEMVTLSPETRHYWVIRDSLVLVENVLYRKFQRVNETHDCLQLIVPYTLRKLVLSRMHDSVTSGHLGVKRTRARLALGYYWFNIKADVRVYVASCSVCDADKKPQKPPRAPMGHVRSGAPWDVLAIDFTGPFPVTPRGNRYILVVTDVFSKYVEIIPVPNQTAEVCASMVLNDVIARWGTPLAIHSDQGAAFESRVFKELCKLLEVKKSRTSARHPAGNGQVERFNRTMLSMVRAYLVGEQEDWDQHLACLAAAYRSTPHESTKLSPNLLALGREVRMPASLIYSHVDASPKQENPGEYVLRLQERMLKAHEVARKHIGKVARRSKEVYDAKLSFHHYQVGDVVWCLHETRKVGVNPKLERAYDGPYLVTAKFSEINFTIKLNKEGQTRVVHHNKLKPCKAGILPRWVLSARRKILSHSKP